MKKYKIEKILFDNEGNCLKVENIEGFKTKKSAREFCINEGAEVCEVQKNMTKPFIYNNTEKHLQYNILNQDGVWASNKFNL